MDWKVGRPSAEFCLFMFTFIFNQSLQECSCFIMLSQCLSHVQLFATPSTAACQASPTITNSGSLLKLMSIESVIVSAINTHKSPSFWTSFLFRSPQSIKQSSLCYTVGFHQLSILYIVSVLPSASLLCLPRTGQQIGDEVWRRGIQLYSESQQTEKMAD